MAIGDRLRRRLEEQVKRRLGRRAESYVRTAEQMVGTEHLRGYRKWMDLPARNKALLRKEHDGKVARVSSFPEEITLATTIRCNKNPPCAICERNVRTTDLEWDCPDIIIERLKPVFPHLDILYLHCSGEPLFYHRFSELLHMVRPPTKIRFNSNAVLLTQEKILVGHNDHSDVSGMAGFRCARFHRCSHGLCGFLDHFIHGPMVDGPIELAVESIFSMNGCETWRRKSFPQTRQFLQRYFGHLVFAVCPAPSEHEVPLKDDLFIFGLVRLASLRIDL